MYVFLSVGLSVCLPAFLSVGRLVGRSVGNARVENLKKKQRSLEMIQIYDTVQDRVKFGIHQGPKI